VLQVQQDSKPKSACIRIDITIVWIMDIKVDELQAQQDSKPKGACKRINTV
jgi:hypothetical protein